MAKLPQLLSELIDRSWTTAPWPQPRAALSALSEKWATFFASADKDHYRGAPTCLDGFFPMNSERAVGRTVADPKEFFHIYEASTLPPFLAPETRTLHAVCCEVASNVMKCVAGGLALGSDINLITSRRTLLRIVNYPPSASECPFAAEHTDITLLTIIPYETAPGLEILAPEGITALDAPAGRALILAGDMLELLSGGRIRSTRHRVRESAGGRQSFVFFANPDDETRLDEQTTAASALKRRLKEMGFDAL